MAEGSSGTGSKSYILPTGDRAADRLRLLDEVYGASTRAMLLEAGLRPGMRVLDVACGVGTVSCWLAEQVGPTGKVVAADISAAQLGVARATWAACDGLPEIEFVEASAYATGLESESFDMVHTRLLLCHLEQPEAALAEFYRLLKPGGVLVCHDLHLNGTFAVPACEHVSRAVELGLLAGKALGVDYNFGLRLPGAAMDAGFQKPVVRVDAPMYLDGAKKRLWEWTFQEAVPVIVSKGAATEEEALGVLAAMARTADDERVMIAQYPLVGVWAAK